MFTDFVYWCYVYLLATITYNMVYVLWFLRLMAANSDRCTYIACTLHTSVLSESVSNDKFGFSDRRRVIDMAMKQLISSDGIRLVIYQYVAIRDRTIYAYPARRRRLSCTGPISVWSVGETLRWFYLIHGVRRLGEERPCAGEAAVPMSLVCRDFLKFCLKVVSQNGTF